jgi:23S rRNA-/tRNA-specific pseudouridylate synthase
MVIGQTKKWTQRISEQFQERRVRKHYWAVVEGELAGESRGRWVDWMRKCPEEARSEIVAADQPGAQEAILTYEVVATRNRLTWLRIELETGRTHQIRLQCAQHGHPVVGDELYHSKLKFGPQTTDLRARWIGLHARQLTFAHPRDGSPLVYQAGLSSVWGPLTNLFPEMLEVEV